MTSSEWLNANPPTHKCRMRNGNIRPEQCEKRKEMAHQRFLAHHPNPEVISGAMCRDVHESIMQCADCPGPEPIKTHTYQRLDRFKPVDKKFGVRAKPKKAQQSKKESGK